jgi:hypothetical protein
MVALDATWYNLPGSTPHSPQFEEVRLRHSLFVVLIVLAVSSPALAQTEIQAPTACALREPRAPHPRGLGIIIGLQDPAVARANLPYREAQRGGPIDPRYLNDLRAAVRQDNGIVDNFDVPPGMTAHVGDRVKLQGSYRSAASACSYIPHMAIPDDAPAA